MKLYTFPLFILILISSLTSCQSSLKKQATMSQARLDEADLLIESRQFSSAEESAITALENIEKYLARNTKDKDFRILRARALLTIFMSKNVIAIEGAVIRPRSLVRLPDAHEYHDYENTVTPAKIELESLVDDEDDPMSLELQATAHAMLGMIFRLNIETVSEADKQYEHAITAYKRWILDLKNDPAKFGSRKEKIRIINGYLHTLRMAQIEVTLLGESWVRSLALLEEVMARNDLLFFKYQFELLEHSINDLENKIEEDRARREGHREQRLSKALEKARKKKYSLQETIAQTSSYRLKLLDTKENLAFTQNNLMYRIICYYNLKQTDNLNKGRQILRDHYPELDATLADLLEENQ